MRSPQITRQRVTILWNRIQGGLGTTADEADLWETLPYLPQRELAAWLSHPERAAWLDSFFSRAVNFQTYTPEGI
ncbi:MAG: hypothetical protein V2B18_06315 [Pseudomonadota bacterium]